MPLKKSGKPWINDSALVWNADGPGDHVGSVTEGEIVGELALVNATSVRNATVLAGEGGVELLAIDRAMFNHFTGFGSSPPGGLRARVAAAMRAACCRRILQTLPQARSEQDIEALMSFLSGLQVWGIAVVLRSL